MKLHTVMLCTADNLVLCCQVWGAGMLALGKWESQNAASAESINLG